MARFRLRSRSQVVERCQALRGEVHRCARAAPVARPRRRRRASGRGEALGTLLWALQLLELPPYDRPFDDRGGGRRRTRPPASCATRRSSSSSASRRGCGTGARGRRELQASGTLQLPARYSSVRPADRRDRDARVRRRAAAGPAPRRLPRVRQGLPPPAPEQHAEAHSIADERHHALNWLAGEGATGTTSRSTLDIEFYILRHDRTRPLRRPDRPGRRERPAGPDGARQRTRRPRRPRPRARRGGLSRGRPLRRRRATATCTSASRSSTHAPEEKLN